MLTIGEKFYEMFQLIMGRSRKDPHSPHRGEKKLFLIIVSVLEHPKGVGG
jgi:hypothetical protein